MNKEKKGDIMIELDFNRDLNFIEDDENNDAFKTQLVGLLRNTDTAKDVMEATILDDLVQRIAGSDEAIDVSEEALDVLEKNINKLMKDEENQLPNWLTGTVGKIIQEGRGKLDGDS